MNSPDTHLPAVRAFIPEAPPESISKRRKLAGLLHSLGDALANFADDEPLAVRVDSGDVHLSLNVGEACQLGEIPRVEATAQADVEKVPTPMMRRILATFDGTDRPQKAEWIARKLGRDGSWPYLRSTLKRMKEMGLLVQGDENGHRYWPCARPGKAVPS